ncbi:hypothetical protein [Geomicrobium sp. JCM 19038]|uniref:hypothetical protein n=1 Tax=Geomicrobium sp. JCM 19038 TaxID=1460635 RepID=UPI00045F2707|nr:hypothetical protein [Geomicrobium sp. JCM 19038]GAK07707.1 hypothetical protein JCM19038_1451 [Geomicrobium sp. JCM 19038]
MTSKQSLAIRTQTKEFSSWSVWYISIYLLIYIGINVVTYFTQGEITWTFIEGSFSSTLYSCSLSDYYQWEAF